MYYMYAYIIAPLRSYSVENTYNTYSYVLVLVVTLPEKRHEHDANDLYA